MSNKYTAAVSVYVRCLADLDVIEDGVKIKMEELPRFTSEVVIFNNKDQPKMSEELNKQLAVAVRAVLAVKFGESQRDFVKEIVPLPNQGDVN